MKKIKVFFPRVEAGLGHIMTCDAVREIFEKKYSKYCEIITFDFYKNTTSKTLRLYGKMLTEQTRLYTKCPNAGHLISFSCEFFGTKISSFFALHFPFPWSNKKGVKFLEQLDIDVIFSTHWATNYYAEHMKEKPFTVMYCPDARLNRMFKYPADLTLCSMKTGFDEAKSDKIYDSENLKMVPFCIRNSAFEVKETKSQSKEKLGVEDRFTILLTEGGYGNGKMPIIVKSLIEKDLPINIIAICGKNEKLLKKFKKIQTGKNTKFMPLGFVNNIFGYINAADLFCGKAGNMIAEPTFFGVPSIVSGLSTGVENHIANYYIDYIKCAILEENPKKAVDLIIDFYKYPHKLDVYKQNAISHHNYFGAEKTADVLFEEICKRFNLKI